VYRRPAVDIPVFLLGKRPPAEAITKPFSKSGLVATYAMRIDLEVLT